LREKPRVSCLVTKLEEWRSKKSWRITLPLCPVYVSKTRGEKDISLSALCSKEKRLTLTPDKGFKEITIADPWEEIDPKYKYLTFPLEKTGDSPENLAKKLVNKVEDYLVELWDSNRFHLVMCSAGMDSRIIAWILAGLRNKMGKDWLGEIHFRCHGFEAIIFKHVMKKQGWKNEQYSVYKDGKQDQPDYYNIGEFRVDINAFHAPTVDFFDDIIEIGNEKNIVLVSGVGGGELFCYPLYAHRSFTDNRFRDLLENISEIRLRFCKEFNRWFDILTPYLGYEYLEVAFRVPSEYFKWVIVNGQKMDLMRATMLKIFNDNVPTYVGHKYNLKITSKSANYMKEKYTNSKFYRDFQHLDYVRNAKPWVVYKNFTGYTDTEPNTLDLKLYGYATMYENVGRT
jgi:hypothetical protein